ncbi:MAG: alpha/beta hydrolase [Alphaproteobacteria bacterium]|nr:alpha/beta hydrolase [Alphaproteobacteria bacterium]
MPLNERDIDFEGMKVHCWGGGTGYPIVMIHGSGPGASTVGNWRNVLDPLTVRYKILAADLIGFGRSGRKSAEPYFDLDMWVRQGQKLLDELAPRGPIGIIAHSLSAYFAIKLALANERIDKLLLTGPIGQPYKIGPEGIAVWTFPQNRADLKRTMEILIDDKSQITEDFLDNRMSILSDRAYKDYFVKMFAGDKQRYVDACRISDDELGKLKCDVAIVQGRNDRVTKLAETGLPMSKKIAKCDLYAVSRCGHGPALEQPAKFMAAAINLFG